MEITLSILKANVTEAVMQLAEYCGAKAVGDDDALKRVGLSDEDEGLIERFFEEARGAAVAELRSVFVTEPIVSGAYALTIEVSKDFETGLQRQMSADLLNYFTNYIVAKWLGLSMKSDADAYAKAAVAALEGLKRKACIKRKPTRPSYN